MASLKPSLTKELSDPVHFLLKIIDLEGAEPCQTRMKNSACIEKKPQTAANTVNLLSHRWSKLRMTKTGAS